MWSAERFINYQWPIHFPSLVATLIVGVLQSLEGKGKRGGRWFSAWDAVHMAAALASCRMALISTGWTISHLSSTNGCRNQSSPFVWTPFPVLQILVCRSICGQSLTIESLLMSGSGSSWTFIHTLDQRSFGSSFLCYLQAEVKIQTKETIHSLKRFVVNGLWYMFIPLWQPCSYRNIKSAICDELGAR